MAPDNDLLVRVKEGELLGSRVEGAESIRVFKAVPYALPPTGVQRWRPAKAPATWDSTRLATEFSQNCIQQPYPKGGFFYSPGRPWSEDCLYLNIWTPAQKGDKLAVMVWIHGGGLTRGSGATSAYDGTALAKKGVILVTINYRLGVFGYFAHPDLSAESPNKASGNYGTTDQVAALKWIQNNIAEFGGDPDKITIFGESAGSFSVNHLMASPLAKGLFSRAIGESGAALGRMASLREGEAVGTKFALSLDAQSIDALRAIPAAEVLRKSRSRRFRPIVDGWVFPDEIYRIFERGEQNQADLMVGFNADEGTTLGVAYRLPKDKQTYIARTRQRLGDLTDEFLAIYPADDIRRSSLDAFRDSFVTWSMQTWAMQMAKVKSRAYLYYFSHWPNGAELGAYHAGEIVYVFNNVGHLKAKPSPSDLELADLMSDYWVAFAKRGRPYVKGSPKWKPYTRERRNFMEFKNGKGIPGRDLLPGRWEFFNKVNKRDEP